MANIFRDSPNLIQFQNAIFKDNRSDKMKQIFHKWFVLITGTIQKNIWHDERIRFWQNSNMQFNRKATN